MFRALVDEEEHSVGHTINDVQLLLFIVVDHDLPSSVLSSSHSSYETLHKRCINFDPAVRSGSRRVDARLAVEARVDFVAAAPLPASWNASIPGR
ncbi:hypothetical protein D9619_009349 [Psilocybe cf. subviscida]|uniref:Uncharacterized protein n=1 Tax=Psilocybe cf. subviscida TaxID=2480587 RepID=A0A8H5FAC2_9AGAR|nr:hypothetical protein D9619_009349 [Psilocybe cf. subviscida]